MAGRDRTDPAAQSPLWTLLLAVTMGLGLTLVGVVAVVRGRVLHADTYASALVAADVYERTYTEVLADPELADVTERLLGELRLGPGAAVQARAKATNALRWAIPPAVLRGASETVIAGLLAYLRGDTDRVDADVALDALLARVDEAAITEVRTLLASALDDSVATVRGYRAAVTELADQLAAGVVPDAIPKVGGTTFDPDQVVDAVLDALGERADRALRVQIEAAVASGDERDALITALGALVAGHVGAAADRLREEPDVDVVVAIAEHARQPAGRIIASLDRVRDAATWFRPATAAVGAVLAAAAALALVWRERERPRRAALVLAVTLVATGVAQPLLWWLVSRVVRAPLDAATTTGDGSWDLPAGVRAVLADVRGEVADAIGRAVWRIAAVLVLAGAAVAAAVAVAARRGTRRTATDAVEDRPIAVAVGAAVIAVAVAAVAVGIAATTAGDSPARACNGHVELCDRRYDEVVQAATHNSMSSPGVVDVWPEHDGDIASQLDAGVRTLLIDTHYWPPAPTVQRLTELAQPAEPRLSRALVDAVYPRLRSRIDGREGTFLCHIHCVFGGVRFVAALTDVRAFLEANPDDVVTLIVQDDITVDDTVAVFDAAGLTPYVHAQDLEDPWPTLGALVDRDERLVVFAEEERPPPDWYVNAFEAMQETPFLFLRPEDLSCESNRGGTDAPLFLMNHWIQRSAPDRVDSVRINRLDVLVDRARQCERERGRLPTYLAVNFYNLGDVVAAADVLNGVAPPP